MSDFELDVPGATLGDYAAAKGAIYEAATAFIDWEILHGGGHDAEAIAPAGRILLEIARRLP